MSGHAPPFYCPYCGEEDIRPGGTAHGEWACGACLRVWSLRFLGIDGTAGGGGARTGAADGAGAPVGDDVPAGTHAAPSAAADVSGGTGVAR